jgi:hypothetical protein
MMSWEDVEGSCSDLISEKKMEICLKKKLRETKKDLSKKSWPPVRDLKQEPPKYEAWVLITRVRRLLE